MAEHGAWIVNIVVTVPPPVEPVTAAEAFFELKLTTDPQTDVSADPQYQEVLRQIASAREQCEQITRRSFVQQTLCLMRGPATRDEFRRGYGSMFCARPWPELELLRPPFISLASVKYFDDSNTVQIIDPANYYVAAGLVPKLRFVDGFDPPSTYLRDDAIQVEYVAGYPPKPADPNAQPPTLIDYRFNVPASIRAAVLVGVKLQSDSLDPNQRQTYERAQASLLSSFKVQTF